MIMKPSCGCRRRHRRIFWEEIEAGYEMNAKGS
jgi:hypothetical protein